MGGHAWAAPWATAVLEDVLPAPSSIPLWLLTVFPVPMAKVAQGLEVDHCNRTFLEERKRNLSP